MSDEAVELTEQAQALLATIRAADGWINRAAIAHALEKNKLYVWDVQLLERMAAMGLIETRTQPVKAFNSFEYQYRAVR